MKDIYIISVIFFVFSNSVTAQPDTLWTKLYKDGYQAYGYSVKQTDDEGFVFTGSTTPYGYLYSDLYLVKTDSQGNLVWSKTFGSNFTDRGQDVQQTEDDGYIVVGTIIPAGETWSDVYLIKTDENGDSLWTKHYGGLDTDWGCCVEQTTDGGFIISGNTNPSPILSYPILIKTDENGEVEWYRVYDFVEGKGSSVIQNQEGNYIIAGISYSIGPGEGAVLTMKVDANGDTIWIKTYGGNYIDAGNGINEVEGGYAVAGATHSFGAGDYDFFLIRTNEDGDSLWSNTYGGDEMDNGLDFDLTFDGGYVLAGWTESFGAMIKDYYIVRTDSTGDSMWTLQLGGYLSDIAQSIQQTDDGGYIVCGTSDSFEPSEYSEVWLVKLDSSANVVWERSLNQPNEFTFYQPFPNPFNSSTNISFELRTACNVNIDIFDVTGRNVWAKGLSPIRNQYLPAGLHLVIFDAEGLTSGIYFVRLKASNYDQTRKIVFMK